MEDVVDNSKEATGTNLEGERETLLAVLRLEPGGPRREDRGREPLRLRPREALGLRTLI